MAELTPNTEYLTVYKIWLHNSSRNGCCVSSITGCMRCLATVGPTLSANFLLQVFFNFPFFVET